MNQNRTKLSTDSSSLLQQAASDSAGLVWIPYSSNLFPIAQDLVEQGYLIAQVAGRMNAIPTYGGHPVASEMGISFKITPDGYNYLVSTGKSTKMATWEDWIDILTGAPGTNSSLTNQAMHEVAQYIVDLVGGDENRIANWVRQNVQESDRDFPDAIVRRWQQQGKSAKEPQFSTMVLGGIVQNVPPVKKMITAEQIDALGFAESNILWQALSNGFVIADPSQVSASFIAAINNLMDMGYLVPNPVARGPFGYSPSRELQNSIFYLHDPSEFKSEKPAEKMDPSDLSTTQGVVLIKVQRGLPIAKDSDMVNSLWDAASQLEWLGYITRVSGSLVERQYALTPLGQQAYDWINDYGKFDKAAKPAVKKVMYNGRDITSWDQLSEYDAWKIFMNGPMEMYDLAFEHIYRGVLQHVQSDPSHLREWMSGDTYFPSEDFTDIARVYDRTQGLTRETGRNENWG